jgi:hypothetical protein
MHNFQKRVLKESYLGSDLVLYHPSGVSTLYLQVATLQKRATLAKSPPILTTQQVPDHRGLPKLSSFRVISFTFPNYVIYRLIVPQADAQGVLHNVYSFKMVPQTRVIRHHPVYRGKIK